MKYIWLGSIVIAVLVVGVCTPASAQSRHRGRATADRASASLSLGYGFRVTDEGDLDDDANPYGLGIGARVGYTLHDGLYLGGLFNYFLGEEVGDNETNGRLNQMNFAADVGYDVAIGDRAVLRPLIGFGATIVKGEVCVLGVCADDQTDPYLLIAPGIDLVVAFDRLFVGGVLRYHWLPDDEIPDGLMIGANLGALL